MMLPQAFAAYLVNAAWQIPLVALCAAGVLRFASLSPRARNGLWLAFLAAAAILPAVSLKGLIPQPTPVVARIATADPLAVALADPLPEARAAVRSSPSAAAPAPDLAPPVRLAPAVAWTMTAAVAAFAAFLLLRLASAALAARRLVRGARPTELPAQATEALEALALAHGREAPPVLASPAVRSPAVVGALRPVILLPRDLPAAPEELTAALLHEMAHVVRNDYAVNLACELFTLPVCWHPALIGLKAGVRASRELACDAIAASAMASRKTYARCLVSLARTLGDRATETRLGGQALAVGLFGRSDLEDRLMHLMKPREKDAPFVGAARALGLAAVGASVLGSAALLHVSPVLAQPAPPAAPAPKPVEVAALAAPAAPPAPAAIPAPPVPPVPPAPPAQSGRRHGLTFYRDGVLIERGQTGYRHTWTGSDGVAITVVNDDASEPTAEQKQRWEADAKDAEAKAAKAEAMVNSPEFKARIAKAEEAGRRAEAMVNSPEFKARIAKAAEAGAKAEAMVNSPEFKARIAKAEEAGRRAQAMVDSPEFKARIAKAEEAGRRAQEIVNSPEFKAKIARAEEAGRRAQAMVNSPEFRDRMQRMERELNDTANHIGHQFDDLPPTGGPPQPAP